MRYFLFVSLLALALACTFTVGASAQGTPGSQNFTISINQFVEHPSLDETVRGFKEQLADSGLHVTYNEHNAQASVPNITQIVNQIIDEKPDLVLAVATPSAQITFQNIKNIPILFTAVTDPVAAGLVPSLDKPNANITGTTDMNPVAAQLALILEVQPTVKRVGIIYNAGEVNSTVQVELAKQACQKLGITLEEATAANTAMVTQAAQSLVGKIDAFYLPTDNTVISSFDSIVKVAIENKIPIYPAEDDSVRKGGLAVISLSYYELGRQTGRMAVKILRDGANVSSLPVEAQENHRLIVNTSFAASINFTIPESVLSRAQEIITSK
ncbi:MAG: ABC transporter substrate-binding protein [Deltaproteobacteria bacterium]|jgi:putative ABC transport system substrate-binding protein|nr:ABC transporter substrate-binding protein [Deltaproteobacteria bacterium]